ncbi:MAG: hypothetical protein ABIE07_02805 [Candidatus Zixiibacteriota bacterium]
MIKKNHCLWIVLFLLSLFALMSCKRTYLYVAEEVYENTSVRFTTKSSFYTMGKSIALTHGGFELVPSDSTVLFIEGQSTNTGKGGISVAELRLAETARFYVTLPNTIRVGEFNIEHKSICEITGNLNYRIGETLFTCQRGSIIVDSLVGSKIYGTIDGDYLNTRNQTLKVEGNIKAGQK